MPDKAVLISRAWLRHGIKGMFGTTEPGLLVGRGGRVLFVTQKQSVFDAARSDVKVNWPWWEFGAGVHVTVGGQIHRLSFARPPYAEDVSVDADQELASRASLDLTGLTSIGDARASANAWRQYLGAS